MSDITMCKGGDCPYKNNCYRYTSKHEELCQSYFVDIPLKDGKCDLYWGKNAEDIWNELKEIFKNK